MLRLDVTEVHNNLYSYGSYVNGTIVIDGASSFETTDGDESLLVLTPEQSLGPFYPAIDFFSMDNDLTAVDDEVPIAKDDSAMPTENKVTFFIPTSSPVEAAPVDEGTATSGTQESSSPTFAGEETVTEPADEVMEIVVDEEAEETVDLASSSSQRRYMMAGTAIGFALLCIALAS